MKRLEIIAVDKEGKTYDVAEVNTRFGYVVTYMLNDTDWKMKKIEFQDLGDIVFKKIYD